jgi:hypothetical protein
MLVCTDKAVVTSASWPQTMHALWTEGVPNRGRQGGAHREVQNCQCALLLISAISLPTYLFASKNWMMHHGLASKGK